MSSTGRPDAATPPPHQLSPRLTRVLARMATSRSRPALVALALIACAGVAVWVLRDTPVPIPSLHRLLITPEPQKAHPNAGPESRDFGRSVAVSTALPASAEPPSAAWGRRIIRRATLDIALADVDRGLARLIVVVESVGGFVAGTESQTDETGTLRASVTAHVPPEAFSRALATLEGLGRVAARRISGEDVSEEFVDLEARVRNLERQESQLLGFMERAQKVSDLLSLENEVARVRGEIERLRGRIRFLQARTELTTIQVGLSRLPAGAPAEDTLSRAWERIRDAFRAGWYAAFHVAAAVAILVAQMSPLAIPLLAAWALYRRRAHRRLAIPPPVSPATP